MPARIALNRGEIADFARRWKIQEIALFGSVLGEDFGSDSDGDVLTTLAADASVAPLVSGLLTQGDGATTALIYRRPASVPVGGALVGAAGAEHR